MTTDESTTKAAKAKSSKPRTETRVFTGRADVLDVDGQRVPRGGVVRLPAARMKAIEADPTITLDHVQED